MLRSGTVTGLAAVLLAGAAASAAAAEPPEPEVAPVPRRHLASLARDLKSRDRETRYAAATAIRDDYRGASLDILPQIVEALAKELDVPTYPPGRRHPGMTHLLRSTLTGAAIGAGPPAARAAAGKAYTRHPDPLMRAAGLMMWGHAAHWRDAGVDPDELLGAIRGGLNDPNRVVRVYAVYALGGFCGVIPRAGAEPVEIYPPRVAAEAVRLLAAALGDPLRPREGFDAAGDDTPAAAAAGVLMGYRARARPVMADLARAARTPDLAHFSCLALRAIAQADATAADEVVAILRPLIRDKSRPCGLRCSAVAGLVGVGPAARWAVPELSDALVDPDSDYDLRSSIYSLLGSMAARAGPAVPAILTRLERTADDKELRDIFFALGRIGPAASPAEDALTRWIESGRRPQLNQLAWKALQEINK